MKEHCEPQVCPVPHSTEEDWCGVDMRGPGRCAIPCLLSCLPTLNTHLSYLTFDKRDNPWFSSLGDLGLVLVHSLCGWHDALTCLLGVRSPASQYHCHLLAVDLPKLCSPNLYLACQLSNLILISTLRKGKGRLRQNDKPFIVLINEQISVSVQSKWNKFYLELDANWIDLLLCGRQREKKGKKTKLKQIPLRPIYIITRHFPSISRNKFLCPLACMQKSSVINICENCHW